MFPPWHPPQQCSDPNYAWLQNSAGQSACELVWAFGQPCVASLGNKNLNPLDSSTCACSTVPYSLLYACGLCSDRKDLQITFGQYSGQLDCENTAPAGQYFGQTFGVNIPSWAYQQLTGSDSFDSAKAKQVAGDSSSPPGGGSPPADTNSPQPQTTPMLTPTQVSPAAPTEPPAQTSDASPSPSSPAAQSVPDTASGSQPVTDGRLPGGGQGTINASSINTLESGSSTTASGGSALPGGNTAVAKPSAPADRQHTATGPGTVPANIMGTDSQDATASSRGAAFATPSPSARGTASSANRVGPIVGGVIGGVVVAILALILAFLLLRRRRQSRYRNKQAELAQAALEWDKRPGGYLAPSSMEPDMLEPSTARTDDGASEAETLRCDDDFTEKKSVTYGDYPEF
ncbi:hypothetical protein FKP32DRAFT_1592524 [Trametes sanguinea]|nr:hypothetical protein FKP32DRAFT_1592524 [Trametes sanguinea]